MSGFGVTWFGLKGFCGTFQRLLPHVSAERLRATSQTNMQSEVSLFLEIFLHLLFNVFKYVQAESRKH